MSDRTREQLLKEFFNLLNVHQVSNWAMDLTESESESIEDVLKIYFETMMEV